MLDNIRSHIAKLRGFSLELTDPFVINTADPYEDSSVYLFNKQLHDIVFSPVPGTGQPRNLIDLLSDLHLPESISRAIQSVLTVFPSQPGAASDDEALANTFDRTLQYGSEVDQVINGLEKNIIDAQSSQSSEQNSE